MTAPAKKKAPAKKVSPPRVAVGTSYILDFKLPAGVEDDENHRYYNSERSWRVKRSSLRQLKRTLLALIKELDTLAGGSHPDE